MTRNATWARDDQNNANTFATHLENNNQRQGNHNTQEEIDPNMENLEINLETLKEIEKNLNLEKAPGCDLIRGEIKKSA